MKIENWFKRYWVYVITMKSGFFVLLFCAVIPISISHAQEQEIKHNKSKGSWNISQRQSQEAVSSSDALVSEKPVQTDEQPEVQGVLTDDDLSLKSQSSDVESSLVAVDEPQIQDAVTEQTEESIDTSPVVPVVDLEPSLRQALEDQFSRIRSRIETENAFSAVLGEDYLSYGLLLRKAGRLDEARDMFVDALHISKVNNGVYAIEQRPLLRELFETNFLIGNIEESEDSLKKILWLEDQQSPVVRDRFSYDLLLKLSNHYIDAYLFQPGSGEVQALLLSQADKYSRLVINRHGSAPMSEALMPYGELALVHLFKRLQREDAARLNNTFEQRSQFRSFRDYEQRIKSQNFYNDSFSKSDLFSKLYLKKAQQEGNVEQIVHALLGLGDVNLLFGRQLSAAQYYELAWLEAQKLPQDHPLVVSFEEPVELPAFNYAYPRKLVKRKYEYVTIPLVFDLDKSGRVGKVNKYVEGQKNHEFFNRARRAVKKTTFRPPIENGKMIGVNQVEHVVRVLDRKKKNS